MLNNFLHALLRGLAVFFGMLIFLVFIVMITENPIKYFKAIMAALLSTLFLVYGFGGNSAVIKFLPWFPGVKKESARKNAG
jgi:hypothetical protein